MSNDRFGKRAFCESNMTHYEEIKGQVICDSCT